VSFRVTKANIAQSLFSAMSQSSWNAIFRRNKTFHFVSWRDLALFHLHKSLNTFFELFFAEIKSSTEMVLSLNYNLSGGYNCSRCLRIMATTTNTISTLCTAVIPVVGETVAEEWKPHLWLVYWYSVYQIFFLLSSAYILHCIAFCKYSTKNKSDNTIFVLRLYHPLVPFILTQFTIQGVKTKQITVKRCMRTVHRVLPLIAIDFSSGMVTDE
jgi:hypothetical protein